MRREYRQDHPSQPLFETARPNAPVTDMRTALLGLIWYFGPKTGAWQRSLNAYAQPIGQRVAISPPGRHQTDQQRRPDYDRQVHPMLGLQALPAQI